MFLASNMSLANKTANLQGSDMAKNRRALNLEDYKRKKGLI